MKLILRSEAKKSGYHWKWCDRAIEIFKNKKVEPKEAIEKIKVTVSRGKKIGSCVYV